MGLRGRPREPREVKGWAFRGSRGRPTGSQGVNVYCVGLQGLEGFPHNPCFCLVLTIPMPFSGRLLIGQVVSLSSALYLSDCEHRRGLHSNKGARTVSSCPGP